MNAGLNVTPILVDLRIRSPMELRSKVLQKNRMIGTNKESLRDGLYESGSRTRGRVTFLCVAKEKYPKERPPDCRLSPARRSFRRELPEGISLSLWQRAESIPRPSGLTPPKPPVLGAADGMFRSGGVAFWSAGSTDSSMERLGVISTHGKTSSFHDL